MNYYRHLTLQKGIERIKRVCKRLNLPENVEKKAISIFEEAHRKRVTVGRSAVYLADASLYAACRIAHLPIFLEDFIKDRKFKDFVVNRGEW